MRTSLPGTSLNASGSSAEMLYEGTNGRPEFALYARNTATIVTSTVTAPTMVGLAERTVKARRRFIAHPAAQGP